MNLKTDHFVGKNPNSDVRVYTSTLGASAIAITIFVSLFLGGLVSFFLYRVVKSSEPVEIIVLSSAVLLIIGLYVVVYIHRPLSYVLGKDGLTIRRPIKNVTIPWHAIKDAYRVNKHPMEWTERMGGNGGVFGFYGDFKSAFGMVTLYATRLENYVLIETLEDGRIIITPDDTSLVRELNALSARG